MLWGAVSSPSKEAVDEGAGGGPPLFIPPSPVRGGTHLRRGTQWLLLLGIVLVLPPQWAWATLPGRDGALVFQVDRLGMQEEESVHTSVVSPFGRAHRRLLRCGGAVCVGDNFAFSRDGRFGAFDFPFESPSQLTTFKTGTKRVHLYRLQTLGDTDPGWSPSGRQLVFVRATRRNQRDIYVLDRFTDRIQRLTRDGDAKAPDWSSTNLIAYVQRGAIWVMRADGSHKRRLIRHADHPSWSPDGRRLAFVCTARVEDALCTARRDGRALRRYANTAAVSFPSWAPQGRYVAYLEYAMPLQNNAVAAVVFDTRRRTQRVVTSASGSTETVPVSFSGLAWAPRR